MKVEKALNFWMEDMKRKRVPLFITLCYYFIYGSGSSVGIATDYGLYDTGIESQW
jgi:hypothetical protein